MKKNNIVYIYKSAHSKGQNNFFSVLRIFLRKIGNLDVNVWASQVSLVW